MESGSDSAVMFVFRLTPGVAREATLEQSQKHGTWTSWWTFLQKQEEWSRRMSGSGVTQIDTTLDG